MRLAVLFALVLAIQYDNPLLKLPRIYNPPIPFPVTVMRESLGTALQAADDMVSYMNQTAEELESVLSPDSDELYAEEIRTWASTTVQEDQDELEEMLALLEDLKEDSIAQGFQQDLDAALQNVELYSTLLTQLLSRYQSLS